MRIARDLVSFDNQIHFQFIEFLQNRSYVRSFVILDIQLYIMQVIKSWPCTAPNFAQEY